MNGRPTKPLRLVQGHRTKAEIAARAEAESNLMTGVKLTESAEVKADPIAHKEFLRLKGLLSRIDKDDDLAGRTINTHCLLVSECAELVARKEQFRQTLEEFNERVAKENLAYSTEVKLRISLQTQLNECDKLLAVKRKQVLDIDKENILTLQSALRSIPKKEQPKAESSMAAYLRKKAERHDT